MTRRPTTTANYVTGEAVFAGWRDDVLSGTGPVTFPHALPTPEIAPGQVVLIGGAPGAGKTALVMACVVEALRHSPTLRVLVANVEMSASALLDRQLARLSGIDGQTIRRRAFTAEHAERLDAGLATVETFADRLAFLEAPFDLSNVAHAADAHEAGIVVLDYLQRILPPGDVTDPRLRVNASMDMMRRFAAARPAPRPARGKRGRKPQLATPDPAFSPERLAELWKSTPAAPACADDAEGGDE